MRCRPYLSMLWLSFSLPKMFFPPGSPCIFLKVKCPFYFRLSRQIYRCWVILLLRRNHVFRRVLVVSTSPILFPKVRELWLSFVPSVSVSNAFCKIVRSDKLTCDGIRCSKVIDVGRKHCFFLPSTRRIFFSERRHRFILLLCWKYSSWTSFQCTSTRPVSILESREIYPDVVLFIVATKIFLPTCYQRILLTGCKAGFNSRSLNKFSRCRVIL